MRASHAVRDHTVAVAQLLVVVWHLLAEESIYCHLRPQTFVTKLQQWAFRIGQEHLPAPSSKEFVRPSRTPGSTPVLS